MEQCISSLETFYALILDLALQMTQKNSAFKSHVSCFFIIIITIFTYSTVCLHGDDREMKTWHYIWAWISDSSLHSHHHISSLWV